MGVDFDSYTARPSPRPETLEERIARLRSNRDEALRLLEVANTLLNEALIEQAQATVKDYGELG